MYVQVVTYGLAGIDEDEYLDVANHVAPRFSGMSGLLAKLWLGNTEDGRYGAVYLWDDREAMERFVRSDLFEAFNPEFDDIAVEDFDVLENLTAVTQPVLQVLEPKRQPPARVPRPTPSRTAARAPAISSGAAGGRSVAKKAPVVTKAANKAPKKTGTRGAAAPKKVASKAKRTAPATKKAATTAARKTAKKTR